jgi:hypothetical protein
VTVADRFAAVIWLARQAVADAQITKGLPTAIAWLIDLYLSRVAKRFARLAKLAMVGRLTPPRQRKPRPEGVAPPKRKPRLKTLIRMAGYAWIVKQAQGAVLAGTRLHALLDDPAFIALIGLDKRFGTILRPLCAALATAPEPGSLLAREPKPPKPRPPKAPRKPRARKVKWRCAKPPNAGLEFYDYNSRVWHR